MHNENRSIQEEEFLKVKFVFFFFESAGGASFAYIFIYIHIPVHTSAKKLFKFSVKLEEH